MSKTTFAGIVAGVGTACLAVAAYLGFALDESTAATITAATGFICQLLGQIGGGWFAKDDDKPKPPVYGRHPG